MSRFHIKFKIKENRKVKEDDFTRIKSVNSGSNLSIFPFAPGLKPNDSV